MNYKIIINLKNIKMIKNQRVLQKVFMLVVFLVPIILYLEGNNIYIENQNLVFIELIVEIIGLAGLLNYNVKYSNKKYKKIVSRVLILFILFVSFILYVLFSLRHGIGF
jgi:uncharacterized membrane protein